MPPIPLPNKFPTLPTTALVTLLIFIFPSSPNVSMIGCVLLPFPAELADATDAAPVPSSPSNALEIQHINAQVLSILQNQLLS